MTSPPADALSAACLELASRDAALAAAHAKCGDPVWRSAPPAYATIARTIAYQQISTAAAAAIWGRVAAGLGAVTPRAVLDCPDEDWRAYGMSRPKVGHLRSVAEAVESGALNLARVRAAGGEAARAELLAVRGIGRWTAELFCLYAIADMDAFPTADVALMESHARLAGLNARLDAKGLTAAAEAWRPYRGVAAHLLWAALHADRAAAKRGSRPG